MPWYRRPREVRRASRVCGTAVLIQPHTHAKPLLSLCPHPLICVYMMYRYHVRVYDRLLPVPPDRFLLHFELSRCLCTAGRSACYVSCSCEEHPLESRCHRNVLSLQSPKAPRLQTHCVQQNVRHIPASSNKRNANQYSSTVRDSYFG